MPKFTFIDLFAGIGGFRLALEPIGGACVGFSEIDKDAISVYCSNHHESERLNMGDITRISELPSHDFLTAGVPCQSWSIAGRNLGFEDSRGQLWNDALALLNRSRPKAFMFENVKGLADPRNRGALDYIMQRISQYGYHARSYVINSFDYGVPQHRVRIYIVGFRERVFADRFELPHARPWDAPLRAVLDDDLSQRVLEEPVAGCYVSSPMRQYSISMNSYGFNDYFLFNDIRNGHTTIHSWEIVETTQKERDICMLLLSNRRKRIYGPLDGNPLSLAHFQRLDPSVSLADLERLVAKGLLKHENYLFRLNPHKHVDDDVEEYVLGASRYGVINVDILKSDRFIKQHKIRVDKLLDKMCADGVLRCAEKRYDFKNTKISTGINGVSRIFLPGSKVFPTLVASDTNDFVTSCEVSAVSQCDFKLRFIENVYKRGLFRKINQREACRIQGFPENFSLPPTRTRWMKLIGNSVSVPVVKSLANAVVATGVFDSDK